MTVSINVSVGGEHRVKVERTVTRDGVPPLRETYVIDGPNNGFDIPFSHGFTNSLTITEGPLHERVIGNSPEGGEGAGDNA